MRLLIVNNPDNFTLSLLSEMPDDSDYGIVVLRGVLSEIELSPSYGNKRRMVCSSE